MRTRSRTTCPASSAGRCWSACTSGRPGRTASRCCSCSTPDGGTVGFAKVATTALTGRLVAAETATLRTLARAGLTQVTPPRVLSAGLLARAGDPGPVPAAGPPAAPPVRDPARGRDSRGRRRRRDHHPAAGRPLPGRAAGAGRGAAGRADPGRPRRRARRAPAGRHRAADRVLARRLDAVEHRGRRGHGAGLGLGAVRRRGAGRLRRAALRPAAAGARPGRRGRRRGGGARSAGHPSCSRRWACRPGSAPAVAVLYLVEILTRYVGDGQTRWGNWRSMTEGVLAAARAAAPVTAG